MNRRGIVYVRGRRAGVIEETREGFRLTYDMAYLLDPESRAVSLTLPKQTGPHTSPVLFPFFYGLLAEGILKETQCRKLKLDEQDHFGRLLKTTHGDAIGAVTVIEEEIPS